MGGTSVIGDLTALGYDAEWHVVSAASVGASHRRDRIVIIAYPHNPGGRTSKRDTDQDRAQAFEGQHDLSQRGAGRHSPNVANNDSERDGLDWAQETVGQARFFRSDNTRREAANVSRQWWATEPNVGRVADGVPSRVDRLRGLGNAVVPQVAELVGRMVIDYDTNL